MLISRIDIGLGACCGVIDLDGRIIHSTSGYRKLLGLTDGSIFNKRCVPNGRDLTRKQVLKDIARQQNSSHVWVRERSGLSPQLIESHFSSMSSSDDLLTIELAKPLMLNIIETDKINTANDAYSAVGYMLSDIMFLSKRWGFSNTYMFLSSIKNNIS